MIYIISITINVKIRFHITNYENNELSHESNDLCENVCKYEPIHGSNQHMVLLHCFARFHRNVCEKHLPALILRFHDIISLPKTRYHEFSQIHNAEQQIIFNHMKTLKMY